MSGKIRDNSGRFISNWSNEDLNFLKEYYELYSNEYISYKLNKTIDTIQTKAKRIGVKKGKLVWTPEEKEFVINNKDKISVYDMMIALKTKSIKNIESFIKNNKEDKRKKTYWTKNEENYLLNNWEMYTDNYIANKLNKTKSQVFHKRRELGLINDIKKWSIEEDNIIINMHSYTNNDELAYLLGVSKPQLNHRIKKLNLCLVKKYTFDEDNFIKMNYKTETIEDISKALGRPKSGVLDRMYKLGLHLSNIEYNNQLFDSLEERNVYKYISENICSNIVKNKEIKFTNKKSNEGYVPDFIIYTTSKPIIVEYYGLYDEKSNTDFIKEYISKSCRKNEFYNSLKDYFFIPLYKEDMKNNFTKLNKKIIDFANENNIVFERG